MTTTAAQITAEQITADTWREFTIKFDTEDCTRCGGTGYVIFSNVDGGRCFSCGGGKKIRTRAAERAYKLDQANRVELMGRLPEQLKVGDVIWFVWGNRNAWRTITMINHREGSWGVIQGQPHKFDDTVTFTVPNVNTTVSMSIRAADDPNGQFKILVRTDEAMAERFRRLIGVPGVAITRKTT
jgi:ribosomal protein L37E